MDSCLKRFTGGDQDLLRCNFDRTRFQHSTVPGLILMGIWFAGVSLGLLAARFFGDVYGSMTRSAGRVPLSFWDACTASLLPLILSAFAVCFFHRCGALLACGIRGFLVGYTLGILCAVGGLWLCGLLFFSGLMGSPVLLWFLWRRLRLGMLDFRRDWILCALSCVFLAVVDTWVVAPFLAAALSL